MKIRRVKNCWEEGADKSIRKTLNEGGSRGKDHGVEEIDRKQEWELYERDSGLEMQNCKRKYKQSDVVYNNVG